MSTIQANAILDASGGSTTTINGVTPNAYNTMGKNRIINGDMRIDQRNAGASVNVNTDSDFFAVDRFNVSGQSSDGVFSIQRDTVAPTGFTNSLKITTTTADSSIGATQRYIVRQPIEGFNVADLGFGSANAKTINVSFQIRSSLTGTFGGSILNAAQNRSYPFSFTISSADTWEYKTITITGDTAGTWLTNNGVGLFLVIDLGCGANLKTTANSWASGQYYGVTSGVNLVGTLNATMYITGVQLEVGSTATEFERRPYTTELQLCQRYYCKTFDYGTAPANNSATAGAFMHGHISSSNYEPSVTWRYPVEMRAAPTITLYNPETGTAGQWSAGGGTVSANARSLFTGTSSTVIDNSDVALAGGNGWRIQATASIEL